MLKKSFTLSQNFSTIYAFSERRGLPLKSNESIVDYQDLISDECILKIYQQENRVFIDSSSQKASKFILGRPAYCPFASKNRNPEIDWESDNSYIKVACSVLVETKTPFQGLLITKRCSNLRIFPGLWVPPGGHIDENETIYEAARREVTEEIGCTFDDQKKSAPFFKRELKPLCAWESAYPTFISRKNPCPPKRHHLVLYFTANFSLETINNFSDYPYVPLNLNPSEVQAAVWLTRPQIEALVKDFDRTNILFKQNKISYLQDIFKFIQKGPLLDAELKRNQLLKECLTFPSPDDDQRLGNVKPSDCKWQEYKFSQLFSGLLPGYRTPENKQVDIINPSRSSIGTLYAMKKWLQLTQKD